MSTRESPRSPVPNILHNTDGPEKLPQLVTNYKSQSADGLSMSFLFIWLLGDITNLAGT